MVGQLTKSGNIQGTALTGRDGVKLGTVRETFIDLATGRIAFLIVEAVSLLGGSGKFHPVPWERTQFDTIGGAFQLELAKDQFKASPSYDRAQLANSDYGWDDSSTRYFDGLMSAPSLAVEDAASLQARDPS